MFGKSKEKKCKRCEGCSNCIPLGEGDHLCDESNELVMVDYLPTEYYGGCERGGVKR